MKQKFNSPTKYYYSMVMQFWCCYMWFKVVQSSQISHLLWVRSYKQHALLWFFLWLPIGLKFLKNELPIELIFKKSHAKSHICHKIESTNDLKTIYFYGKNTIGAIQAHRKTKPFPFPHLLKDKNNWDG